MSTVAVYVVVITPEVGASALIRPVEVTEEEPCCAPKCGIKKYKGRNIHWVQCDSCREWYHQYCVKVKNLSEPFICMYWYNYVW